MLLESVRKYGKLPYRAVVVHGGPGAPGSARPVAEGISRHFGVVEALQSADSLEGQKKELAAQIDDYGEPPVVLIGHSWGAWLSMLLTADNPHMVKKLILVNAGPFREEFAKDITRKRLRRLSGDERRLFDALQQEWRYATGEKKTRIFGEIGRLLLKADAYDPETLVDPTIEYQPDIFRKIWTEAGHWRSSGRLLEEMTRLECPVVAIHGKNDAHPWQGVKEPLESRVRDFRFFLLENCGHEPWLEKHAKDKFFQVLLEELRGVAS